MKWIVALTVLTLCGCVLSPLPQRPCARDTQVVLCVFAKCDVPNPPKGEVCPTKEESKP